MKIHYDVNGQVSYITLIENALVVKTRAITDNLIIDFDENDEAVGIELLDPKAGAENFTLKFELLEQYAQEVPDDEAVLRRRQQVAQILNEKKAKEQENK